MKTDDLIKALQADRAKPSGSPAAIWWKAAGDAALIAALIFFTLIGLRPDIAAAMETIRFPFKFFVTVALAVTAFAAIRILSRPGAESRPALVALLLAPLLLAVAILLEMAAVPAESWGARLVGSNSLVCLSFIPLMGIGPLAVFIVALRANAPTRPRLAGAVAGLLAGGLAATFYAAHCTDDSPLFVATWYTLAIAFLTALGWWLSGRFVRW